MADSPVPGNVPENFIEKFNATPLGQCLLFWNAVFSEVNYSRTQNCKSGEFILKQIPGYFCWILLKPTNASTHIFYSLLTQQKYLIMDHGAPFRSFESLGDDLVATDFISMDAQRLSHVLYSPQKVAAIMGMWAHIFTVDLIESFSHSQVQSHVMMSLLIWAEDSSQTSSTLQTIRYSYMELLRPQPSCVFPAKILSKWPTIIRSRLLMHVLRNCATVFCKMSDDASRVIIGGMTDSGGEPDLTRDCAENLLSWVDQTELPTYEAALNLSYMGVLHNKEESERKQSYLSIFDKVVDQELKLRDANPRDMGRSSKDLQDLRTHEFNLDFVLSMGDTVRRHLEDKTANYAHWVEDEVANVLANTNLLQLATTKASAYEIEELNRWDPDKTLNKRRKCIEAALSLCTDAEDHSKTHSFIRLSMSAMKRLETIGGVRANLFKKLQIGGVREIFVLTFDSRMTILLLESICRRLCEEVNCEMLTKGDQKLVRSDEHATRVARKAEHKYQRTITNSSDAKTWCQQFVMKVFGAFLSRVLPASFHPLVANVLNLVTAKKLELPGELLSMFSQDPAIKSTRESINELKDQFLGRSIETDLLTKNGYLLNNRSNMMQGILHYTSSLLHSGYLLLMESAMHDEFKGHNFAEADLITTMRESSDDSSEMFTIVYGDVNEEIKVRAFLLMWAKMFSSGYPLWCAKNSEEKSTDQLEAKIEEFNSIWFIRNTVLCPLIKFIAVSQTTPVLTRFDARQQQMSTLVAQILENGGSHMLCDLIQRLQLRTHYNSLGSSTNEVFPVYSILLGKRPHPMFGFFLLQPSTTVGMLGYEFALYSACKSSFDFRRIHRGICETEGSNLNLEGKPMSQLFLTFGQCSAYDGFLERVEADPVDVEKTALENPELLFRDAMNSDEMTFKLKQKACNPDLANAFTFDTDSKLHAASAYVLQTKCLTWRKKDDSGLISSEKMTLYSAIEKFDLTARYWTPVDWSVFFPAEDCYDSLLVRHNEILSGMIVTSCTRRKNFMQSLHIMRSGPAPLIPLIEVVKKKWFNLQAMGADFTHKDAWSKYTLSYPWLQESFEGTLKDGPFNTGTALANFVTSITTKTKQVKILGPVRSAETAVGTLKNSMRRNVWPQRRYVRADDDDEEEPDAISPTNAMKSERSNLNALRNKLHVVCSLCRDEFDITYMIRKLIVSHPKLSSPTSYSLSQYTDQEAKLVVLAHTVQKESFTGLAELTYIAQKGFLYRYTSRQTFQRGAYVGPLAIEGVIDGVLFRLTGDDKSAKILYFKSLMGAKAVRHLIKVFIGKLGLSATKRPPNGELFLHLPTAEMRQRAGMGCVAIRTSTTLVPIDLSAAEESKIELVASQYSIKLVEPEARMPILSYHPRPGMAKTALKVSEAKSLLPDSMNLAPHMRNLALCWLTNVALHPDIAKTAIENISDLSPEDPAVTWARDTIIMRAKKRGLLANVISASSPAHPEINTVEAATVNMDRLASLKGCFLTHNVQDALVGIALSMGAAPEVQEGNDPLEEPIDVERAVAKMAEVVRDFEDSGPIDKVDRTASLHRRLWDRYLDSMYSVMPEIYRVISAPFNALKYASMDHGADLLALAMVLGVHDVSLPLDPVTTTEEMTEDELGFYFPS